MHAGPPSDSHSAFPPGLLDLPRSFEDGCRIFRAPPLERFLRRFNPAEFAADLLSLGVHRSNPSITKRSE